MLKGWADAEVSRRTREAARDGAASADTAIDTTTLQQPVGDRPIHHVLIPFCFTSTLAPGYLLSEFDLVMLAAFASAPSRRCRSMPRRLFTLICRCPRGHACSLSSRCGFCSLPCSPSGCFVTLHENTSGSSRSDAWFPLVTRLGGLVRMHALF